MKTTEDEVRALKPPVKPTLVDFDLERPKELAEMTLESLHEEAEHQVLAHIEKNFKDPSRARGFLQEGKDQTQADCPYCGQDLQPAAELIAAYREYFDTQLQEFLGNLANELERIRSWNFENTLTGLVAVDNSNRATLAKWHPHIGEHALPDVESQTADFLAGLQTARDHLLPELERKRSDPSATVQMELFDELVSAIDRVNAFIRDYNTSVGAIEAIATEYLAKLPASEVGVIRAALENELEVEARFTQKWSTWASNISAARSQVEELTAAKTAKGEELASYSSAIFNRYQERLNQLLSRLGVDYRITNLLGRTDERSSESFSDFGFVILEQLVPIAARRDDSPSLTNTLSEGDKSTLAFAFFVASLERHPSLSEQVVILDDPLSSLDETRREATCAILLELTPRVAQLCILTHKLDFLHMLCDKFPQLSNLLIRSDAASGSRFEALDVAAQRRSRLQKLQDRLERYTREDFGPSPEQIQGDIRVVFEIVFKHKYLRRLTDVIATNGGLGTILKTLEDAGVLGHVDTQRLYYVCGYTNSPHHGALVDDPARVLTRQELIPLIGEMFDLIEDV